MSRAVLLSVKPRYARALLAGSKTVEVRRKFPLTPAGTVVVIYASSPERAVLGTVTVRGSAQVDSREVWSRHSKEIEIDEDELARYLEGAEKSVLLEVEEPIEWAQPVWLESLRELLGIDPPQSFRYLSAEQVEMIRNQGGAGEPLYPK